MTQLSIKEIFLRVSVLTDPGQRELFLDDVCGQTGSRRELVNRLLQVEGKLDEHLEDLANQVQFGLPSATLNRVIDHDSLPTQPGVLLEDPHAAASRHERLGPYKLLEVLGEGGMGLVFMAEQVEPVRRLVAVKIIKPGMDSQQILARFEAERQALSLMNHPNIAAALDAGTTSDGRPYFVMELVKGRPITNYCDECHLSTRVRLELFVEVCSAIQHAHRKGIIHRDLKPSNVMVAHFDDLHIPKVIDFGVAKAISQSLTERTLYTGLGQIVGTLEYMSPEQARFNQLDIDTRSDVYSLGVLLYEILTGSTPIDQGRLRKSAWDEALRMIREEQPLSPSQRLSSSDQLVTIAANRREDPVQLNKQLRGELDWIVMKALEKDRNRRYESAKDLAADIERYLAGQNVLACPPTLIYRCSKLLQRHATLLAVIAIIGFTISLGLVGTLWQGYRAIIAEGELRVQLQQSDQARREAERLQLLANEQTQRIKVEKQRADQETEKARVHEQNAVRDAASARAIAAFLENDLLSMIDYENQLQADIVPDKDITVRTLLDRASARLNSNASIDPANRASLHHTIGQAFYSLGFYAKSHHHLTQAVELTQAALGKENPVTLRAQQTLGSNLSRLERFAEAEPLLTNTLQLTRQAVGNEHEDVLQCLNSLVYCYFSQNKFAAAKPHAEELVQLTRNLYGENDVRYLNALHELAAQLHGLGEGSEADRIYRDIYQRMRQLLGPDAPQTMSALQTLGSVYFGEGKYREALESYQTSYDFFKQIYDEDHPTLLNNLANQARILYFLAEYQQAFALAKPTFEKLMQQAGFRNHATRFLMFTLVEIHNGLKQFEQAAAVLDEMERRLAADPGIVEDRFRLNALRFQVFQGQRKMAEAEELGRKTLHELETALGADKNETQKMAGNLAVFYFTQGRYEEAQKLFDPIWERQKALHGVDHYEPLLTAFNVACVRYELKRQTEAIAVLEDTLEKSQRLLGYDHSLVLLCYERLTQWYQRLPGEQVRQAKAAQLHRSFSEGLRDKLGPLHPKTVQAHASWALALHHQKDERSQQILAELERELNVSDLAPQERLATLVIIGQTFTTFSQYAHAIDCYEKCIDLAVNEYGPFDQRTCDHVTRLCAAYRLNKQYLNAEQLLRKRFAEVHAHAEHSLVDQTVVRRVGIELVDVLARHQTELLETNTEPTNPQGLNEIEMLLEKVLDSDGPITTSDNRKLRLTHSNLSTLQQRLGDFAAAEKHCRAQWRISKSLDENQELFAAIAVQSLIRVLCEQSKFSEIDEVMHDWQDEAERASHPEHPLARNVIAAARQAKLAQGDYQAALLYTEKLEEDAPVQSASDVGLEAVAKAEILFLAGKKEEGEELFLENWKRMQSTNPLTRNPAVLSRLRILFLSGRNAEARQLCEQIIEQPVGNKFQKRLQHEIMLYYANSLLLADEPQSASNLLKALIDESARDNATHWIASAAQSLLGECHLKLGLQAETPQLLSKGYQGLLDKRPRANCSLATRNHDLHQAARRMHDFYIQQKASIEADQWQQTMSKYSSSNSGR